MTSPFDPIAPFDATTAPAGVNGRRPRLPAPLADEEENALVARLAADVTERLAATQPDGAAPTAAGELVERILDEHARTEMAAGRPPLDPAAEARVARAVRRKLSGLGGFAELLENPEIENINANGCDNVWVRYADGRREQIAPVADSDDDLIDLVRALAARTGVEERRFDRGCPRLSLQLPDGSRLFAVMALTARPCVSIRRHRLMTVSIADLVRLGTINPGLAAFLTACVRARKRILITGGAGVGKTTFLRALASVIPRDDRLLTIEDAFELALDRDRAGHGDVSAFQAREPNVEGEGAVDVAELVRWSLRMSPDRIIVGEVRGSEVVPMLNAMSAGCDGSLATVHAHSSRDAFGRLAAYAAQSAERMSFEATGMLVAAAVDFVAHLAYTPVPERRRVVSSVREVVDVDGGRVVTNEVWQPGPDRRATPRPGALSDATLDDLAAEGFDPAVLHEPPGWGWSP